MNNPSAAGASHDCASRIAVAAMLAFSGVLAGCAVAPNVEYQRLNFVSSAAAPVPFQLTDSLIAIGLPSDAGDGESPPPIKVARKTEDFGCAAPKCRPDLAILALATSYTAETYVILPRSRHFVSTSLSPRYFDNSLRLKVLTIEAKDHRLEAVKAVAALAAGVVDITGSGSEGPPTTPAAPLVLPLVIALADARCDAGGDDLARGDSGSGTCQPAIIADPALPTGPHALPSGAPQPLPGNADWRYTLAFLDNPRSSGFVPRDQITSVHGAMVTSLCRRVEVRLSWVGAGQPVPPIRLLVNVADPNWLLAVPFPSKGAVTMHSLCGIDVQAQPVTEIRADDVADAFVQSISAIHNASRH